MKRLLVLFICILSTYMLFAENAQYELHLAKAKEYESQKKWIYALSEYYDAMQAEPTIEAEEAYTSYMKIADSISIGNIPFGEDLDVFETYDAWISLIKEYEQLWTEYCPWYFSISFVKTNIDFEKRTADYSIIIKTDYSQKYKTILHIIYNNDNRSTNHPSDIRELLQSSSSDSIYNREKISSFYPDKVALTQNLYKRNDTKPSKAKDRYGRFYPEDWFMNDEYPYRNTKQLASLAIFTTYKKNEESIWDPISHVLLYDIKLDILNEDGSIFYNGKRHLISYGNSTDYATITVDSKEMKRVDEMIKNHSYKIIPTGIYLNYGNIPPQVIEDNSRTWIKTLPEIEIPLENVTLEEKDEDFISSIKKGLEEKQKEKEEMERKQKEEERLELEKKKKEQEEKEMERIEIERKQKEEEIREFEKKKKEKEEKERPFKEENEIKEILLAKSRNEKLIPGTSIYYTSVKISSYYRNYTVWNNQKEELVRYYLLCNYLNEEAGMDKAYIINNSNKDETKTEFEYYVSNFNKIILNPQTKGYHMITEYEINYLDSTQKKLEKKRNKLTELEKQQLETINNIKLLPQYTGMSIDKLIIRNK